MSLQDATVGKINFTCLPEAFPVPVAFVPNPFRAPSTRHDPRSGRPVLHPPRNPLSPRPTRRGGETKGMSDPDQAVLIEIEGLTKRFGAFTAVDNVSFNVSRGEVLGFLGPNGAGKSTTMRMLAGFMIPTSGTAQLARPAHRRRAHRSRQTTFT